MITRKIIAENLLAYMQGKISLKQIVSWAEDAMMDSDFENNHEREISETLAKIGLIDVNTFGLLWEDCDNIIHKLGFNVKIDLVA